MSTEVKKKNDGKQSYLVSADTIEFLLKCANEFNNLSVISNSRIKVPTFTKGTLGSIIEIPASAAEFLHPFKLTVKGGVVTVSEVRIQMPNITTPLLVPSSSWTGAGTEFVWVKLTLSGGDGFYPVAYVAEVGHGLTPPTPATHHINYTITHSSAETTTGTIGTGIPATGETGGGGGGGGGEGSITVTGEVSFPTYVFILGKITNGVAANYINSDIIQNWAPWTTLDADTSGGY